MARSLVLHGYAGGAQIVSKSPETTPNEWSGLRRSRTWSALVQRAPEVIEIKLGRSGFGREGRVDGALGQADEPGPTDAGSLEILAYHAASEHRV